MVGRRLEGVEQLAQRPGDAPALRPAEVREDLLVGLQVLPGPPEILPADEAPGLISEISQLENLSIRGLMTMPPYFYQPEKVKPFFAALRELRDEIKEQAPPNVSLEELSMGMTGDFEVAIEEGATLVRIGTAIFGERK